MKESRLWGYLEAALPDADMTRHEERWRRGIPDVSFGLNQVNGWIELKAYHRWTASGFLRFKNFKPAQRHWLWRRGRAGDHCYLLVVVGSDIMLFGWWQLHLLGSSTRRTLWNQALIAGPRIRLKELSTKLSWTRKMWQLARHEAAFRSSAQE